MDKNQAFRITGPRQIVLVSCLGPSRVTGEEIAEIVPVTSHMLVSLEPFIYAVAIDSSTEADSIISETGVFAVSFISEEHLSKVEALRIRLQGMDKRSSPGISIVECDKIECIRIEDAAAYLECEIAEAVRYGNRVVFFGRVVHREHLRHGKRPFHNT